MAEPYLRRANQSDADLLFRWANDRVTRENAFHTQMIAYADHLKWFAEKLASANCVIYIYCQDETPIGQARIDVEGKFGLISYSIDSVYRLNGHGGRLLALLEAAALADLPCIGILIAKVKKSNIASQRKLLQLSYTMCEKEDYVEFQKKRDDFCTSELPDIGNLGGVLFLTNNQNAMRLYEWMVQQKEKIYIFSDKLTCKMVKNVRPDILISYNYRHIIGSDVLDFMAGRAINLHASLLPWNRGASPTIFSFLESTPSGVTIHQLDAGLDTGDIILQEEVKFDYDRETLESSYRTLHDCLQRLFITNWAALKKGEITPRKQCGSSTYHRSAELIPYRNIIDYNDTVAEFLRKAATIKGGYQWRRT